MEQRAPAYNFFLPQLSEILLHSDVQWVFESNISEGVGGGELKSAVFFILL